MGKQNGALIKEKRTAAGMSQEALAKAAGGEQNEAPAEEKKEE